MKWNTIVQENNTNKHFVYECVFCFKGDDSSSRNTIRAESIDDGDGSIEAEKNTAIMLWLTTHSLNYSIVE